MGKSTPYNFGLLDTGLTNNFPISAPNVLAGFNPNYSGFMPGGSSSSGFDWSQLSDMDPDVLGTLKYMDWNQRRLSDPLLMQKQLEVFSPFYLNQAKEMQKFGIESNLWGAAINTLAKLPETITKSFAQAREGRLAGQQAILNQQQRPYNIGGFSMPYNSYRV